MKTLAQTWTHDSLFNPFIWFRLSLSMPGNGRVSTKGVHQVANHILCVCIWRTKRRSQKPFAEGITCRKMSTIVAHALLYHDFHLSEKEEVQ